MFRDFKEFAVKGNGIDMAIGITLGVAFGRVITSFVNDVFMPPLGLLLNKVDFANLFVSLSGEKFTSLAEARASGAPVIAYGVFLNTLLDFLLVAMAVFIVVKQVNRIRRSLEEEQKTEAARMTDVPTDRVSGEGSPPTNPAADVETADAGLAETPTPPDAPDGMV